MGLTAFVIDSVLNLDTKQFTDGLAKSKSQANAFGSNIQNAFGKVQGLFKAVAGAWVVKQGVSFLKNIATETGNYGDNIDKMSQKLGLSTKAYQEWGYILEANGASIDGMKKTLKTMNKQLDNSQTASRSTRRAYKQLGLSMVDLSKMSTEDRLAAVVKAFQDMPDSADKSRLALEIFGNQASELMPLLNGSSEDVEALKKELADMGGLMSDEQTKEAAAYNDAVGRFQKTLAAIRRTIGNGMLPTLTAGLSGVSDALGSLNVAYQEGGMEGLLSKFKEIMLDIKFPTWDEISGTVSNGWEAVKPFISNMISATLDIEPDTVDNALSNIATFAGDFVNGARDLVKVGVNLIGGDTGEAHKSIVDFIKDIGTAGENIVTITFGLDKEKFEEDVNNWFKGAGKKYAKLLGYSDEEIASWDAPTVNISNRTDLEGLARDYRTIKGLGGDTSALRSQLITEGMAQGYITNPAEIEQFIKDIEENKITFEPQLADDAQDTLQKQANGLGITVTATPTLPTGSETHAAGISNVPYTGFPAVLGKGEAVLTRLQAQEWRRESGSTGAFTIDYDRLAASIAGAMGNVSFTLDGAELTRRVNQQMAVQMRHKRYTT